MTDCIELSSGLSICKVSNDLNTFMFVLRANFADGEINNLEIFD
jgi:hypothetical protein